METCYVCRSCGGRVELVVTHDCEKREFDLEARCDSCGDWSAIGITSCALEVLGDVGEREDGRVVSDNADR